ncbi:unnamed protein product [Heterobilharzia americana]|nr:unnamed protein product [Heterobilharzia americana]
MFGGEFYDGRRVNVFSDLLIFQCKDNQWFRLESPNCPPPRSGHQSVYVKSTSTPASLWIFGGEFASPSQTRFYHYSDLWCLNLRSRKWEQINAAGPCARSGHRMLTWKTYLILFGGFSDSGSKTTYFDDVWQFDLINLQWTRLTLTGNVPSPRSAALFFTGTDQRHLFIVGGYSKSYVTRDLEKGIVYSDVVRLTFEKNAPVLCSSMRASGVRPKPPRISMSGVHVGGNRALLFGGVHDVESEDGEKMSSYFHDDLFLLDFDKARWHAFTFCVEKNPDSRYPASSVSKSMDISNETAGGSACDFLSNGMVKIAVEESRAKPLQQKVCKSTNPSPRASAGMALIGSTLYLYGGVFEVGDRKVTLDDFYKLDISHPVSWECLYPGTQENQEWYESESDDDDVEEEAEDDDDTGDSSESETMEVDGESSDDSEDSIIEGAPTPEKFETFSAYWKRTTDFWCELVVKSVNAEVGDSSNPCDKSITENPMVTNLARKLSKDFYQSHCRSLKKAVKACT